MSPRSAFKNSGEADSPRHTPRTPPVFIRHSPGVDAVPRLPRLPWGWHFLNPRTLQAVLASTDCAKKNSKPRKFASDAFCKATIICHAFRSEFLRHTLMKARHGFECVALLVFLSIEINLAFSAVHDSSSHFAQWHATNRPIFQIAYKLFHLALRIVAAYLCSRLWRPRAFIADLGFSSGPTLAGWFFGWTAILWGILELFLMGSGITESNTEASGFESDGPALWYLYILTIAIISPFVQELLMRGFLYPAFRQSFGFSAATFFVFCAHTYFHWTVMSSDLFAFLNQTLGVVVLCLIREKTKNTWNCFLFHFAFNAIVLRQWMICLIGMILALSLFLYTRTKNRSPLSSVRR
jgi:membrane protease YdiL (CAAX protease family)